jgi:membrane-associated phospholipid phosphatase
MSGDPGPLPPEDIKKFTGWTIENSAVAAIAEMAAIACQFKWWERCDPGVPELNPAKVGRELDMLEQLMGYRDGVMSEALAQATGIIPYFQGLAGFTAASHKETTDLCIIALNLGQFMVMYYKEQYNRPRPSQLRPALLPSMEVPGHAAYPSGHSTESHLIAGLLEMVLEDTNPARPLLHPLADRIAINREVMGLHYRSDSEAGISLASEFTNLFFYVSKAPWVAKRPILYQTIKAAWLEWHRGKTEQDFEAAWT